MAKKDESAQDERARAVRVNAARMRWRADLHRLNGDEAGAQLNEYMADLEERYEAAKMAAHADRSDAMLDRRRRSLRDELRSERQFWRSVRGAAPAAALDNFSEPSDDELLGSV